jgi:putative endonuclease
MLMNYYIYIMASQRKGTLYVGVTNNLLRRIHEHRNDLVGGFTQEHKVHRLVYWEYTDDIMSAITREKQIKKWNRQWKINLIERGNPTWRDLYEELG